MVEIKWSARSLKDIDEIALYISKDSIQYAEAQVLQFFIKVKLLEKYPLMGRRVPELNIYSLRQVICGHYRIIYEILNPKQIAVVTVHHQSRLLKNNPAIKKKIAGKRKK